jgi:hypothetical protein
MSEKIVINIADNIEISPRDVFIATLYSFFFHQNMSKEEINERIRKIDERCQKK